MRSGDMVRVLKGYHLGRLGVVEIVWSRDIVEIFFPGSMINGGSFQSYKPAEVERVGYLRIGKVYSAGAGKLMRQVEFSRDDKTTILNVCVREDLGGATISDRKLIRRYAAWSVVNGIAHCEKVMS